MIKLLLLISFIVFKQSGYAYLILFLFITYARYTYNRNLNFFIITALVTTFFYSLPLLMMYTVVRDTMIYVYFFNLFDWIDIEFGLQAGLAVGSFIYGIWHKFWKNDVVFTILEPIFAIIFGGYVIRGGFYLEAGFQMDNWVYAYITFQSILIIIKAVIAMRASTGLRSLHKKWKMLIYSLPKIDASFGFNDLGLLNVSGIVHPTSEEVIIKEVEFMKEKTAALFEDNYKDLRKIEGKNKDFDKRYFKSR